MSRIIQSIHHLNLQVHIELGLCEALCSQAMRISVPAKDEKWFAEISELEALFPAGTLDHSVERIYQQVFPFLKLLCQPL